MDKRKSRVIPVKHIKKKIYELSVLLGNALFGTFCCFLGIYMTISLAKNGSGIFYYAMAFASPGTAIEILSTPPKEENDLSTELSEEAETSVPEPKKEDFTEENPAFEEKIIPEVPENRRGKVTEIKYSAAEGGLYVSYGNAIIKNCTKHSAEKIRSMLETKHGLFLSTEEKDEPQVLIYHTHATEGFEPADRGYFDLSESWRSTDKTENMVAVGEVITSVLEEKGIGALHDETMHDDPGYNGSYKRSAVTVSSALSENQRISVCLDIHRDAIEPSEKEIMKPTAVINGKKAAQIMIISGCDDGSMNMPEYWENLRFAAALADKLEELYPGICRPVLFDYRKYNMDLSKGLLLIEIGATGNTLEEAKYSAELLANALFELLSE